MTNVVRWFAVLAVLGLILAGCSGGGESGPTRSAATRAPTIATPSPTATQVATPTSTATPVPTSTATPAPTPTATPPTTPTATPTASPTPSASATPTRTTTPATAAHPLSPEIVVVGDVAPEREAAFRTAFEGVFAFYADRFGIEAPGLQLYIGTDPEAVAAVYRDLGGSDPDALSGGRTIATTIDETNAIFIAGPFVAAGRVPARLVAAEFFLLVQRGLSSPAEREPAWLIDGSAHYAAALFQAEQGIPYEAFHEQAIVWAAPLRGSMRSLESRDGWLAQPNPSLYTSIIATEWLAAHAGDGSYVDYWRQLAEHATWQEAFAAAFGISVDDFYEAFEKHRSELFADLREIRGVVLGPDGEAIEGVGLLVWQGLGVGSGVVGTGPDGSFAIPVRDGIFTLQIYADDRAAVPPFAGWAKDGGGLTVECAQAARIAVDRSNVTGFVVRLPAGWAEREPNLAQSQWQCDATTTATARPTPTATPRPAATPRPTPTPPPIRLYPEIVFVGDVAPTSQAAYHAAMREVVAYFADRHGLQPPEFGIYVGPDVDAVRAVYSELTGRGPRALQPGGAVDRAGNTAAIFVLGDFVNRDHAYPALLAHEYLHVMHANLSNFNRKGTPGWLTEGAAVYEAAIYVGDYQTYLRAAIVRGANYGGELRDLARIGRWDPYVGYPLGAIAAGLLAEQAGADWHIDYWRLLDTHPSWRSAFSSAFGMTASDFYDAFEVHLEELLSDSPASRVSGVVLGSGDEALRGIRLLMTERDGRQESWLTETRADGTFDLHVLRGPIEVAIHVREDGTWRHVGWYGEGGLMTDRSQATVIEVGDTDVTGIEIRLTAGLVDLPEVQPPRVQGTVLGPDGEPLEGIGVWVWGGSYENSTIERSAPDGTFDIAHQNGTFTLRIYTWKDEVWHLLGYYGKTGFTPREEQAASIEVAGADVSGIEIRLPGRIRGTVRGPDGAPAEGIALWLRDESTDDYKFVGVSPDGTFDVLYGNGTFTLRVSTWKDGGWHLLGYYGGETGFTPVEAQAAEIEVDGADVTGIQIRLPWRIRGTVRSPDGAPAEGIALWLWDTLTDDNKFVGVSPDGTFDVVYRDGTFTLRVYTLTDGRRHQIGWYGGETGFTPVEAQAAEIEVDGADISGIQIRLPWRIRGTVRGPDGAPAEGIALWLRDESTDDYKFVAVSPDGTFDVLYGDGTFTLRVSTWKDEGWRHIGWYGGATGFTPDGAQAAEIEVDGADVSGIEVRLPWRIRGTVRSPDGAPAEGIALWLRDESTDDYKFVGVFPDGTFDVLYGNGTFTLRVSTWKDEGWRHIGWYGGETGFTPVEAQAAEIEVDGADISGIQIRLPWRIRGTVRGPDGAPTEGIALWLRDESTDDYKFVAVSPDGTFDVVYRDGTFTLRVYTLTDGRRHQIGWYGGEDGFTTDEEQAAVIKVDGADVSGIEIRLPAAPADLQGPRIRGTVLGADGAPLEGFGVWVWGGATDNSKLGVTSADGTFDIAHQDGTFVLRIYIWKVKAWHLVGWYGVGGFTANEEGAARIEVVGADVTGIEIRLPPRVRGIVLNSEGEPVEGVGLWLWGGSPGSSSKFGGSAADGTFDLFHRDGTYTIRVFAWDGQAWRHIGWYEDDGFTTIDYRATKIELDGADVTGIEIRLRLDPADMPTIE